MSRITWDVASERRVENGVDRGILFEPTAGVYNSGVPWNGLVNVNEEPSGAEPTKHYASNIAHVTMYSAEEFAATVEAFMAPSQFDKYDGIHTSANGVKYGGQGRGVFGLYYRTNVATGDDPEAGYKHHLVYGCQAAPSARNYSTVSDSPEPITFSWSLSTQPVAVAGDLKPTSIITIDSTDPTVESAQLAALLDIIYGTPSANPRLPLPDEVEMIMGSGVTQVTPTPPTFNGTDTITIPTQAGVVYTDAEGTPLASGALAITADTIVKARPAAAYTFSGVYVDAWMFDMP